MVILNIGKICINIILLNICIELRSVRLYNCTFFLVIFIGIFI